MFDDSFRIDGFDPELAAAIASEIRRQEDHVELIASENYASPRVLEAQGPAATMAWPPAAESTRQRSAV